MTGLKTDWLNQAVENQAATLQNNNSNLPEWLQVKRQRAAEQMQSLEAPSRKLESWRYADVSRLSTELTAKELNATVLSENTEQKTAEDDETIEIIINESGIVVNGQCPDWLEVKSLQDSAESDWHDLSFGPETVVNLANNVLVHSGGSIKVKATNQTANLRLVYGFDDAENWQYVRNQLMVESNVKINFTEVHQSGRVNVINVYDLAANVELNRRQNFQLSASEQLVSFNQFEVADKVQVTNMSHHIGGSLQHHIHWVNFNAEGANYKSGSINKSFDNNNITDIVNVNHNHKNNVSDVTHRSIAKDKSQIYNNAKALVAVGADGSEIEQDLKNILLSPDAKIFSKPELEVYADEVIAAHGSTIGALDEKALFYLQSRGVDIEQARDIMIESFEQEALIL